MPSLPVLHHYCHSFIGIIISSIMASALCYLQCRSILAGVSITTTTIRVVAGIIAGVNIMVSMLAWVLFLALWCHCWHWHYGIVANISIMASLWTSEHYYQHQRCCHHHCIIAGIGIMPSLPASGLLPGSWCHSHHEHYCQYQFLYWCHASLQLSLIQLDSHASLQLY